MAEEMQTAEFWVAVGFILFLGILLWFKVGRAMGTALDGRAERIRHQLDEATRLREEAQRLLAEYQRKQRNAAQEADELLESARAEAERFATQAAADLEEALKRREQMAVEKIAQAEADALRQVQDLAVDVAMAASAELIRRRLDEQEAGKLVEQAIEELPGKLH